MSGKVPGCQRQDARLKRLDAKSQNASASISDEVIVAHTFIAGSETAIQGLALSVLREGFTECRQGFRAALVGADWHRTRAVCVMRTICALEPRAIQDLRKYEEKTAEAWVAVGLAAGMSFLVMAGIELQSIARSWKKFLAASFVQTKASTTRTASRQITAPRILSYGPATSQLVRGLEICSLGHGKSFLDTANGWVSK